MKTIKFGIFGLGRGSTFFDNVLMCDGEVVAVCERDRERAEKEIAKLPEAVAKKITIYDDFDKFIEHGMDAVFLCNCFHEHAPFAIKALEKNIHVLSECTSNGTMAEGVALVRAAKKEQGDLYACRKLSVYEVQSGDEARL